MKEVNTMLTLTCVEPKKFEYERRAIPQAAAGRAIIKIKRIGVCGTDLHAFEGTQPFLSYPRVLGHELSGELIDAGDAPGFKPGETVSFIPYFSCGICIACRSGKTNCCVSIQVCGVHIDGGMCEFLSVPSNSLLHAGTLTVDEMALVEPLAIGAHGVRRAGIQRDEFVLVVGAGPIGLGAMEFAKIGGGKVIALDVNGQRLQFCKDKLSIPHTVNARSSDVYEQIKALTGGDMPTAIIDATGNLKAINDAFSYMAHGARYVLIGLQRNDITFSHPEFHKREGTLMSSRNATRADFEHVLDCMRTGRININTYITHRAPFAEVKDTFEQWLDPKNGVIKAMIEL